MLVSVITPTYNSEKYISDTYSSILQQSHSNWEWVVTDDFSTDGTFELLSEFSKKDKRVKVFRNSQNLGAALTRNNSIDRSSGDYIAFLDSDDLWHHTKLTRQLDFMQSHSVSFSFTSYELIDERGSKIGRVVDKGHVKCVDYRDMLRKKATLGCSTVMLKKNDFEDLSMPNIRTGQDYALWLKLLKNSRKAFLLDSILTLYRVSPNSISRNKFKKAIRQWQVYRKIENLGFTESVINFTFYAYRAFFRK